MVPMCEPETEFGLDVPAGLVRIRAECRAGKAELLRRSSKEQRASEDVRVAVELEA